MFYDFTTLLFFVENMREAFALQMQKRIWDIKVWNFNGMLTNKVVSLEQPNTGVFCWEMDWKFFKYHFDFRKILDFD